MPTQTVPDALLSRLSEFIAVQMGLHFPKERWRDLERRIGAAARDLGFDDPESCLEWLVSAPLSREQIGALASHLTVGETYFLRDRRIFEILEERILPQLIESRAGGERCLRIWSAGCATGEEPYSIAILLCRMIPSLKEWKITILGTDINLRALEKATAGVYSEWSFRDEPPWLKERYFRQVQEGRWEIADSIRKMVTFSYLNLMEDVYPALLNKTTAMDLILCRNVLMYFVPQQAGKVVQHFYRSLVDGGGLIVSPTETSPMLSSRFTTVSFPGAFLYRKESSQFQAEALPAQTIPEVAVPLRPPPVAAMPSTEPGIPSGAARMVEAEEEKAPPVAPQPHAEALALYEEGRYEAAAKKLAAVTGEGKDDTQALALLARIHANQGRLAEAITWCEKTIAADKLNAGHHYLLATILQEHGQLEEAVQSLKRALYLDQSFVLGHFALGNLTQRQGRLEESRRHFQTTLTLLGGYRQEEALPESEGMTAGRLAEIIRKSEMRGKSE